MPETTSTAALGNSVRIVLVETTHPGNIGAAARAMHTMGLSQLTCVNTVSPILPASLARSAGSEEILRSAHCVDTLEEALQGCVWVLGTSARNRHLDWPLYPPREAMAELHQRAQQGSVAIVFGGEQSGLSNQHLQRCHAHVCIPTGEVYRSLNLAAAVQILCYEWRLTVLAREHQVDELPLAKELQPMPAHEDQERFYEHLEEVLRQVGFLQSARSTQIMSRLRRLFARARVEPLELNILRGILTAVQKSMRDS
jgi:tRNA (cytidine32/uridine32-2'-O)-methyltransferase